MGVVHELACLPFGAGALQGSWVAYLQFNLMKVDERIVDGYLNSLHVGRVVYEPDGKVPPDFVVDGRIAVEVRRLNQHYDVAGSLRGLEQDTIPLRQRLENLLTEITHDNPGTWFVMFNFRRPLADWRLLRRKLKEKLRSFLEQPSDTPWRVEIVRGFTITTLPATLVEGKSFLVGGYTDGDAGGWVVAELVRNMSAYIAEKTKKVAPYLNGYPEWWLVFVDYIGQESDAADIRTHITRSEPWAKVLVLNPISGGAYEI
jgi:hypothetical protein